MADEAVSKAGSVIIEELKLVSSENIVFDLTDFLVELNIFEDMFSNYLYGNMVLSDSRNLIEKAPIVGEEYLNVKIRTPTFPDQAVIKKTFRVFKISDRNIVRDNNTQTFVLHFASIELFYDILLPLYRSFEGTVTDVASQIYTEFLSLSRDYEINELSDTVKDTENQTPMAILNESSNKVKFISPGWTPFKCLNWLASKAIPKNGTAKNFLFFESNKSFYFGSVEHILKDSIQNNLSIGTYSLSVANIRDNMNTPDVNREMFIAKDVEMVSTTDHVKNYTNGYLASRLITLDVYNKNYQVTDYDYVTEYKKQFHTSGSGITAQPVFSIDSLRNAATNISYYPVNPKLFDNFTENISEKMPEIYGNRKSSLLDLTNVKFNITVPGRTDVQIGNTLYFSYPALEAGSKEDEETNKEDKLYSGYYLITAIRHKINKVEHTMVMELIKDSLEIGKVQD